MLFVWYLFWLMRDELLLGKLNSHGQLPPNLIKSKEACPVKGMGENFRIDLGLYSRCCTNGKIRKTMSLSVE